MKTIVCYGDSNTWGFVPAKDSAQAEECKRFGPGVRWTGVLAKLLGEEYRVIEEGLNGRTTDFNDVLGKYRNGAKYLGVCLGTNKPVDLLIFMLGVNDTKRHLRQSSQGIAKGLQKLIKIAKASGAGPKGEPPEILVIAPAHLREEILESFVRLEFDPGSLQKSKELAGLFFDITRLHGCYYMNAAVYAKTSKTDGLHLDAKNHAKLGKAVAVKVKEIFL
jgi:lysophospholipase L1-like esterase